jgi:hypothetical protein
MDGEPRWGQAFAKNILYLLVSLCVAAIVVLSFEKSPEPGTLPRLVISSHSTKN